MRQEQNMSNVAASGQLRQERQRRGWSRAYVAEKIGVADPKTIGRWERGDVFPSTHFLPQLCALFNMPAETLGLWQPERLRAWAREDSMASAPQPVVQKLAAKQVIDPALPPGLEEGLLGRDETRARLQTLLKGSNGPALAALSGWPGVGKTALATSLGNDYGVRQYFGAGVLWANLGPDADLVGELRRWGQALEIDESQLAHPTSLEDWSRAIHARIGDRAFLIIIDDAWTCQEALDCKIGGPNCAYLLTTRIPAVALYFAGSGALTVNELPQDVSLHLLARFVPTLVTQEAEALRELTRLVGGLPLALHLVGAHLRAQMHSGQPRRWRAALERLMQPVARLHLTMPRAPLECQRGLPANAPISLSNEIELSYQRLLPEARLALQTLAGLFASRGSFSEESALALQGVTLEALDHLLDAGLLASTGLGRYTFHQTIADFANHQKELAQENEEIPPQLSVLRQLREQGGYLSERSERDQYELSELLSGHQQETEPTISVYRGS